MPNNHIFSLKINNLLSLIDKFTKIDLILAVFLKLYIIFLIIFLEIYCFCYFSEEIARQLENAGATSVIVHPFFLDVILNTQKIYPALRTVITIAGPAQPGVLALSDLANDDGSAFPHNVQV